MSPEPEVILKIPFPLFVKILVILFCCPSSEADIFFIMFKYSSYVTLPSLSVSISLKSSVASSLDMLR